MKHFIKLPELFPRKWQGLYVIPLIPVGSTILRQYGLSDVL